MGEDCSRCDDSVGEGEDESDGCVSLYSTTV